VEVYSFLLSHQPDTAYGIAKAIGKPTANVYKAIDSLAYKGGVMVQRGQNSICRAIPVKEFLKHIKKVFTGKLSNVEQTLSKIDTPYPDERVYQIEAVPLVFDRCCTALDRCRVIAVIDAFPEPLKQILPAIKRAIKRGVEVHIQAYEPIDISGAEITLTVLEQDVLKFLGSQQLNIVVDGKESLVALMNSDLTQVHQAIWSQGLYLSCLLHTGLFHEQTIIKLLAVKDQPQALKKLRSILNKCRFFYNSNIPDQKTLHRLFIQKDDE